MDDHDGRSETIALMDYVSYSNDYQIHCHSSREEEDSSTAEPVTGRPSLPSPGHNVLILVILTVSFLSALLYLALPIGCMCACRQSATSISLQPMEPVMTPQAMPTSLVLTWMVGWDSG